MKILYPALFITGIILLMLSILMTLPVITLFWTGMDNWNAFVTSSSITFIAGLCLTLFFQGEYHQLKTRQLFLITVFCWFSVSIFSSLPFIFCSGHFSVTDAVFESISGITTTGSTVLTNLDSMPEDILFWRSMLQWLGGIGIIGMAIAVLPFLHVGGMRLFKTESSDWSEKSHPRARDATKALVYAYLFLSLLCALFYFIAGMPLFDAINHAMTTISTGGYSTHDASFIHFNSMSIHWIAILFMSLGSMPFLVHVHFLSNLNPRVFLDYQIVGFILILSGISILTTIYLSLSHNYDFAKSATLAFFNITSVISTTGYVSADYISWGPIAIVLFFFVTFIGGCSGSTSGGMKIFRFQISYLLLKEQITKSIHSRAVTTRYYGQRVIDNEIIISAVAFTYLYLMTFAIITLLLALQGLDFLTSISGAATALANVGPGLGNIIGPSGNFQSLPDATKWVLSIGMLLGRLELLTVIAIFSWRFWNT